MFNKTFCAHACMQNSLAGQAYLASSYIILFFMLCMIGKSIGNLVNNQDICESLAVDPGDPERSDKGG